MATSESHGDLPLLAVVYDTGSAGPLEVIAATEGICRPVFVYDRTTTGGWGAADLLEETGFGIDITGLSPAGMARRLDALGAAGILTFSEVQIGLTSHLAELLGLRYHSPATARRLTHKALQRQCLADHAVESTRFRCVNSRTDARRAVVEVGLPSVVKPVVSASSRNTFRLNTIDDWAGVAEAMRGEGEFIIEELLAGDPTIAGPEWGDYVSVDVVSFAGQHTCLGVLGKFPLVPPFRESGTLHPSTLGPAERAASIGLAFKALDAVGVTDGVTHTEIKLTAVGPRLIEVNGRLGGYVADALRRSTGCDPVRVAALAALGDQAATAVPQASPNGVVFSLLLTTPVGRVRVAALDRLASLKTLPGVESVRLTARTGSVLDSSDGTETNLGVVTGHAEDHPSLARLAGEITESLDVAYEFLGGSAASLCSGDTAGPGLAPARVRSA